MYKDNDYIFEILGYLESALFGKELVIHTNRHPYDVVLEVGNEKLYCIAKKEVRNSNAMLILDKLKETVESFPKKNILLIAVYISADVKEQLKLLNVNYIDGAGNMYLVGKNLFISVEGKKTISTKNVNQSRAFQEAGLKLILVLLTDSDSIDDSYRTLADKAGIALGSVSQIMNELEDGKYLLKTKNGRTLKRKEELIERWVVAFGDVLRPRSFKRSYNLLNKANDPRLIVAENSYNVWWGGEPAAEIYTNYLRPEMYTLYIDGEPKLIARDLKLIPAENGNFNIYQKFWTNHLDTQTQIAPPLVVYSDLVCSGYGRNIEAAKIILKKFYGI